MLVLLTVSHLVFSLYISFQNVGGHPLRMRMTPYGLVVIDSVNGVVKLLENGVVISQIDDLQFPVWADVCCGGIYISELKKSRVLLWKAGKIEKWVRVPRPEMLLAKDERIYVSSDNDVYIFDKNLNLLKKLSFPAKSVYFSVDNNRIIHLEYWGDHPDITIASLKGSYRESIDLGLSKPFQYANVDGKTFVLDFLGKLATMVGGEKRILRVGRFSYGMTFNRKNVYVSSLVESFLREINVKTLRQRFIRIPSPAGAIESCCGYLVACGVFKNEVYILKDGLIKTIKGCDYPLMTVSDPPFVYVLCSDSGKVLKIDFSR